MQDFGWLPKMEKNHHTIRLCKVPGHMGIKENKEAGKASNRAIYMPGMLTTRQFYADYYLIIRRARKYE